MTDFSNTQLMLLALIVISLANFFALSAILGAVSSAFKTPQEVKEVK